MIKIEIIIEEHADRAVRMTLKAEQSDGATIFEQRIADGIIDAITKRDEVDVTMVSMTDIKYDKP